VIAQGRLVSTGARRGLGTDADVFEERLIELRMHGASAE
jgi:hypothetical protein